MSEKFAEMLERRLRTRAVELSMTILNRKEGEGGFASLLDAAVMAALKEVAKEIRHTVRDMRSKNEQDERGGPVPSRGEPDANRGGPDPEVSD